MYLLILLGITSFLFSLLFTPLFRDVFRRFGIEDIPDAKRKRHARPIPRVGGLGIALAMLCAYSLLLILPLNFANATGFHASAPWKLMPAALVILLTGFIDDIKNIRPWQKLGGQTLAASLAYGAGVRIFMFGGYPTETWWNFPLTIGWILLCTNAFNLIDGLDGLAAGIGFVATITTLLAALLYHDYNLALATVPLAGAVLGFLRYNFCPASIFLGDCGSLLIGFLLGCYGIMWSQKSATFVGMTAPIMALSLPLIDVALAIVRRFLRQHPIFEGDRAHIHHRLLDQKLKPAQVALVLYGFCCLAAGFSLLQSLVYHQYAGVIMILFAVSVWAGVKYLRYPEFGAVQHLFTSGVVHRLLRSQLYLRDIKEKMKEASDAAAYWEVLQEASRELGFSAVALEVTGERFEATFSQCKGAPCWQVNIPVGQFVKVTLSHDFDQVRSSATPALFADCIRETLSLKINLDQRTELPRFDILETPRAELTRVVAS